MISLLYRDKLAKARQRPQEIPMHTDTGDAAASAEPTAGRAKSEAASASADA
jgi:hypothetical protein